MKIQTQRNNGRTDSQRKRPFLAASPLILGALTLEACGGGSSSGGVSPQQPAPTPPPPPPPEPDFIEDPAGTFTARDDAGRTLDQADATGDLIVTGGAGDDTIATGAGADVIRGEAGADVITSGAGDDLILAGAGADTVTAGDGDDVIVVVGTTTADQYTQASIVNPGGSGLDLSPLLGLDDINGHAVSDAVAGETIDGGAGNNTLVVYGDVDLTGTDITNVTQLQVNSDVTLSADQLAQFTVVSGDGGSILRIVSVDGSPVSVDLSTINLNGVNRLDIGEGVTLSAESGDALRASGINVVSGSGSVALTGMSSDLSGLIVGSDVAVRAADDTPVDTVQAGATVVSDEMIEAVNGGANSAPDGITLSSNTIAENAAGGIVGEVVVSDADMGDVHSFIISDERFEIVDGNLRLKAGVALDFEATPNISVSVTAIDVDGASVTQEIDIDVTNVADVLEATSEAVSIRVLEDQEVTYDLSGAFVADAALTYTLEGADAALFQVLPNGLLAFNTAPDFDTPLDADGDGVYEVSVRASSDAGDALTAFSIQVDPKLSAISVNGAAIDGGPFIDAFIHPGQNSENTAYRWGGEGSDAPLILTWSIAGANSQFSDTHLSFDTPDRLDGAPPTATEIAAIQDSLDQWAEAANIQFVYVDETADPSLQGDIRFFFFSQTPTGVGYLPGTTDLEGDIFIRDDLRAGLSQDGLNFSKLIVGHEIGHAVFNLSDVTTTPGLGGEELIWQFNNNAWAIQSYLEAGLEHALEQSLLPNGPQILDILAAQSIYGANPNANAGDTVYNFTQDSFRGVWDVSGTDTFDFSGSDGAARIDLRDGHVNSIGEAGVVGIAFDAEIENVVGTAFDDTVHLNDLNNTVHAGAGDDLVTGVGLGDLVDAGEGFDTVEILGNSDDFTITELDGGGLLLTGANGNIELRGAEVVSFNDAIINTSETAVEAPAIEQAGTVYISIDAQSFDPMLWGLDGSDLLGSVPVNGVAAGVTRSSPSIDAASGLNINGRGGIAFGAFDGASGSYVVNYGEGSTNAVQTVELQLESLNDTYLIDVANATSRIDVWDHDGDDTLILDFGASGIASLDPFVAPDLFQIKVTDNDGNEVTIAIHNFQSYGLVEEIVLRTDEGDQSFLLTPYPDILQIGNEQDFVGRVSADFPIDANYFIAGQNRGEGLYNFENPGSDAAVNALQNLDELILGNFGNDFIFGSGGSDEIVGWVGDDTIYSGDDGDRVFGGFGADTIHSGAGNDNVFGDFQNSSDEGVIGGNDIIYAGDGDDNVRGEVGDDIIYLGAGNDVASSVSDTGNDTIYGEDGDDLIDGGVGDDILYGGNGDDDIFGDDIAAREGLPVGNDIIDAGAGNDFVRGGGGDDLIDGGDGDDILEGDGPEDEDAGVAGNDTINGGAGNDTIRGGSGNDIINGGAGEDTLSGDAGDDILQASGDDFAFDFFDGGEGFDTIQLLDSGHDIDLSNVGDFARDVEAFDLTNDGADSISLSADDVLNVSESDSLTILGDASDELTFLDDGWQDQGEQLVNGETFHVYTSGEATLFVDPDIIVTTPPIA